MVQNPLTIVVDDSDVPDDQSDECVEDIVSTVEELLANYGNDPNHTTVFDGHLRTQTNPHIKCPICRSYLYVSNIERDENNGISAEVDCDCGWSGLAKYRLIDLKEKQSGSDHHRFDDISHVSEGNLAVTYIPYADTDLY